MYGKILHYAIAVFAFVTAVLTAVNLWASHELYGVRNLVIGMEDIRIEVKDYSSGHSANVIDSGTVEKIVGEISKIKYNGLSDGNGPISPSDQAYSLTLYTDDLFVIFIVTASDEKSCLVKNGFSILMKNDDHLYETVKTIFDSTNNVRQGDGYSVSP